MITFSQFMNDHLRTIDRTQNWLVGALEDFWSGLDEGVAGKCPSQPVVSRWLSGKQVPTDHRGDGTLFRAIAEIFTEAGYSTSATEVACTARAETMVRKLSWEDVGDIDLKNRMWVYCYRTVTAAERKRAGEEKHQEVKKEEFSRQRFIRQVEENKRKEKKRLRDSFGSQTAYRPAPNDTQLEPSFPEKKTEENTEEEGE